MVLLYFVFAFALFSNLENIEGLECITCYSVKTNVETRPITNPFGKGVLTYHPSCEDGESPIANLSKTCSEENSVCVKAVAPEALKYKDTEQSTIRGCAQTPRNIDGTPLQKRDQCVDTKNNTNPSQQQKKDNGVICICRAKDCNGGNLSSPGFLSVIVFLPVFKYFHYQM